MKYFKKPDGQVFAFEADGSQDHLIVGDLVPMSQAEIDAHLAPPDWRPAAMAQLRAVRNRLLDVVSGIQSDYIAASDLQAAQLALRVKQYLKDLPASPVLAGAGTPAAFEALQLQLLDAIAIDAPAALQVEIQRYAGTK